MAISSVLYHRALIIQLRNEHPDWTLMQIAEKVCLTRERVRQILIEASLPTVHHLAEGQEKRAHKKHKKPKAARMIYCTYCGSRFLRTVSSTNSNGHNFCGHSCFQLWAKDNPRKRKGASNDSIIRDF